MEKLAYEMFTWLVRVQGTSFCFLLLNAVGLAMFIFFTGSFRFGSSFCLWHFCPFVELELLLVPPLLGKGKGYGHLAPHLPGLEQRFFFVFALLRRLPCWA